MSKPGSDEATALRIRVKDPAKVRIPRLRWFNGRADTPPDRFLQLLGETLSLE